MNVLLPALLASAGAAALAGPSAAGRLQHLHPQARAARSWSRTVLLSAGTMGTSLVGVAVLGLSQGLVVTAVAVGAAAILQVVLTRRDEALRRRRRQDVARAARVVSGQLRIGQVPTAALATAAHDCRPLERAAATVAIGGDASAAMRMSAAQPGHEDLSTLAMAWELSERTGAPIAALTRQVSEGLRLAEQNRAQVEAELSGPRASGRLLAALPLLGLAMGRLAGGDPFHFLSATLPGHACILGGVVLAAVGVLWTEHLATAVQR